MDAPSTSARRADAVLASLIGSALGDALGLPYENLSARRAARLLGPPTRFRFFFGRGMVSDDAEHACMTCAAFADAHGDVELFRRNLARRLRWWIFTMPVGVGLATLKSTLRLWLGISPARSGVRSAGNGPAMRAAILGRLVADHERLADFIIASTHLTHRDDRAVAGAYAVAVASMAFARSGESPPFDEVVVAVATLRDRTVDVTSTIEALQAVAESLKTGETTIAFANRFCRKPGRVSGYILETVPVALHAAFSTRDAIKAIRTTIACGGDTDSTASIAGGIVGMLDDDAISKLIEWPCDGPWLARLAAATSAGQSPPRFPVFRRLPRNALMLAIVLLHVARRCLPPY